MSTVGGPESTLEPESRAPDAGHLDDDAECLEDPVHCGDARHQHDRHAGDEAAQPS